MSEFPYIRAATWISRKKKGKRTEKKGDDDDDEKVGGGEKKSGTVVKASLNAIGVKSQTESHLH